MHFVKKHTDLGKAKYHKKYFDEHRENFDIRCIPLFAREARVRR